MSRVKGLSDHHSCHTISETIESIRSYAKRVRVALRPSVNHCKTWWVSSQSTIGNKWHDHQKPTDFCNSNITNKQRRKQLFVPVTQNPHKLSHSIGIFGRGEICYLFWLPHTLFESVFECLGCMRLLGIHFE